MCCEHIERKETTAGGEKERKEETRMGCREGQSLWQPHPEVVRRPLDWLLGGHWRWKRRGFSKVVASSALQMCISFSWEVRMGWSVSDTAFLCGHSQPEMPVLAPFGEQVSANAPPSGPSPSLASHPGPSASLPVLPRPLDMPGFVSLPHWPVSVMGRPLSSGQDP